MFEVIEIEDYGIFLFVVCGGVAMYQRIILMSELEIDQFKIEGEESLYSLVYEVNKGKHKDREYKDGRIEIRK
jgi:hypothetical protein